METSNLKNEPYSDLYTIPSYSSWFSWSNIHEIERISLREFFDGTSITRSPRIYKEYRDFIISKYREDPSRPLTFTQVRKSLVGDVNSLQKVFTFLEKWGLINFTGGTGAASLASSSGNSASEEAGGEGKCRIRVEEGAPHGVRVVAVPNSLKALTAPPVSADIGGGGREVAEIGTRFPPLASYSNLFEELARRQGEKCGTCKEGCDSGYYQSTKDQGYILCKKCFGNTSYGEDKSSNDFKFIDTKNHDVIWTPSETLLLLESVLKHGDDWELVAENVKTKTKLDCIQKLLQLPFGDFMLGSSFAKNRLSDVNGDASNMGEVPLPASETQETVSRPDPGHDVENQDEGKEKAEELGPPQKRQCTQQISDASSSLMDQVARLASVVGPHVTASAAEAAVSELCYENRCTREIFYDDNIIDETGASPSKNEEERAAQVENADGQNRSLMPELEDTTAEKNLVSLTLRMRAATATALGAAAAHAKLLANQEEREIEHLVATIMETQLKKLQSKAKHLEYVERITEKQHSRIEKFTESIIAERITVLQEILSAETSKSKDVSSVKPPSGSVI